MHRRGEIVLPDEDTAAGLYEATAEEAARFGLLAYEVSNYAVPGGESRHNLAYWRYGDYAGIGPGAHGRMTHRGRAHRHAPPPCAGTMGRNGRASGPWHVSEEIALRADRARARDAADGLAAGRWHRSGAIPGADRHGAGCGTGPAMLQQALDEGYLEWRGESLAATTEGRLRLDALLAAIVR